MPNHPHIYFLINFLLQALLVTLCSSGSYFLFTSHQGDSEHSKGDVFFYIGCLVAMRGLVLETKADNELAAWQFNKSLAVERRPDIPAPKEDEMDK